MKLVMKLEIQDDNGASLAGGGITLDNPDDRRVRHEMMQMAERMIRFLEKLKRPA